MLACLRIITGISSSMLSPPMRETGHLRNRGYNVLNVCGWTLVLRTRLLRTATRGWTRIPTVNYRSLDGSFLLLPKHVCIRISFEIIAASAEIWYAATTILFIVAFNLISPQFICGRDIHLFYVAIKIYILKETLCGTRTCFYPRTCGIDVFSSLLPVCLVKNQQKPRETIM